MRSADHRLKLVDDCLGSDTEQCDSAEKRANLELVTISVNYNATDTDEILINRVCPNVGPLTKTISITGVRLNYLRIPACIAENATSLTSFTMYYPLIDDLSLLPNTTTTIIIQYGKFPNATLATPFAPNPVAAPSSEPSQPMAPGTDTLLNGFDSYGNISWTELWTLFPSLKAFTAWNSGVYGLLPERLPTQVEHLALYLNELSGTISPNLFADIAASRPNELSIWIPNNHITGTIPENLMAPFAGISQTASQSRFYLDFSNNELSGSLPPSLLHPLTSLSSSQFILILSGNKFNGTIPNNFLPANLHRAASSFVLRLEGNDLSGTIPADLCSNLNTTTSFTISLGSNNLSGTLPPHLFDPLISSTVTTGIGIELNGNKLSGTIPADLLTSALDTNTTMTGISIKLNNNEFSGPIPETLLYKISTNKRDSDRSTTEGEGGRTSSTNARDAYDDLWSADEGELTYLSITPTGQLMLDLDGNHLNGSIPKTLLKYVFPPVMTAQSFLYIGSNNLTGSVPPELWTSISSVTGALIFNMTSNQLSGSLPSFCLATGIKLSLSFAFNDFTGSIPSTYGSCSNVIGLTINNLPSLSGSIPSTLVNNPNFTSLFAYGTPLEGTLPAIPSNVRSLFLWNSTFDFCSPNANASFATFTGFCDLSYTEACNCPEMYTDCSKTCVANATCAPGSQPSSDFRCLDGKWTATTVTAETFEVPKGAGTVIVKGNLTTTAISIRDLQSSVAVVGCVSNLTSIDVDLNATDVATLTTEKRLQTLVAQAGSDGHGAGCMSLATVALNTKAKTNNCKKVKSEKATSNAGTTLSTYWSLSTNSCNTWWIILASVLCGVAIIVVVVVILVTCFSIKAKMHFRPFVASEGVFMKPAT